MVFECSFPALPLPPEHASQSAQEPRGRAIAVSGPAEASERASEPCRRPAPSLVCKGCGTQFTRETPAQRFCNDRCRIRRANKQAYQRRREREAAADREQTIEIIEQNRREGYDNLSWRNGSAEA
jgi:hypothetical protein